MKLLTLVTLTTGLLAGRVVSAEDCPHVYHNLPPVKKKAPVPVVRHDAPPIALVTLPVPCHCIGEKGDHGDGGPRGDTGRTGNRGDRGPRGESSGLDLRLGVMGSVYAPNGDWAWGPALQLHSDLNRKNELVIDLGLAGPLNGDPSWGRESGFLAHVGMAHYLSKSVGLTLGAHYTSIDGSDANGHANGRYLALDGGLVLRKRWDSVNLRVELAPAIGGLRGNVTDGTAFSIGLTSSAFLGVNW